MKKQRWEESGKRREEKKKEDQRRERVRRKKMQVRENVEKSRNTVFSMTCGSGGSKSRLAKAAGADQLARWEMKNCTPLWREAHLQVKMHKARRRRSTFGSWDDEKVHAVVVRCAFGSQKCKKKTASAFLGIEMMKKCKVLWREGHFEVKMLKTLHARTTFGRQMSLRVAGAKDSAPSEKWAKREGL